MRALLDYHHPQLYESLKILLEQRLGIEVVRPKGRAWYDEGYFNYYDSEEKTLAFLEQGDITLARAKELSFDFMFSTIPLSESGFERFNKKMGNKAKQVVVLGNVGYVPPANFPLLTSTAYQPPGSCFFHQEFHADFAPFENKRVITSLLSNPEQYLDYQLWQECQSLLLDFHWREYGHNARDGFIDGLEAIRQTSFVWHLKHVGEGYGHVVHAAAAIGRPLIVRKSYFAGMLVEKYLIHGKTCIDLDVCPGIDYLKHDLRRFVYDLPDMGRTIREIFDAHVHFTQEAEQVKHFLAHL